MNKNKKCIITLITLLMIVCSDGLLAQVKAIKRYYDSKVAEADSSKITIGFIQRDQGLVFDYSKLSQIILLRHGEPALIKDGRRRRPEAKKYIKDYDSVGIYPPTFTPVTLEDDDVEKIYTSNIQRSIATAKAVFEREDIQVPNVLFREFERKIVGMPNIKMPLKWWLRGSRILWFMGFNKKDIESFREARERAQTAADFLANDAKKEGKTLLVSHGLLNHFIVKYLKEEGWTLVYDGGKGYLSQKVLVKLKPQ